MAALPVNHPPTDNDELPEWFFRLGLHDLRGCARQLVESLDNEAFHLIGFAAIAAAHLHDEFLDLVDRLASYEPALRSVLAELATSVPLLLVDEPAPASGPVSRVELPRWLRELDQLELTGIMRRYDDNSRSRSSYLIEVRLADGQVATGRLSLRHGDVDKVSEFWTTGLPLAEAARFYRKRYALNTTRPYRHVKTQTAVRRILEALAGSFSSDDFIDELDAPIPWPQNLAVLALMIRPGLLKLND